MHVVLSLGSNIDKEKNIRFALTEIQKTFGELEVSPVYETSSVGFDGPAFYNLVVGLHSEMKVQRIIDILREIETQAGRIRGAKSFASRVLDIDVVLFGDAVLRPELNIPRDEIEKYAYVLKPLADLYPDLVHPISQQTISEMWQEFESKDQTVFMAEFPLPE